MYDNDSHPSSRVVRGLPPSLKTFKRLPNLPRRPVDPGGAKSTTITAADRLAQLRKTQASKLGLTRNPSQGTKPSAPGSAQANPTTTVKVPSGSHTSLLAAHSSSAVAGPSRLASASAQAQTQAEVRSSVKAPSAISTSQAQMQSVSCSSTTSQARTPTQTRPPPAVPSSPGNPTVQPEVSHTLSKGAKRRARKQRQRLEREQMIAERLTSVNGTAIEFLPEPPYIPPELRNYFTIEHPSNERSELNVLALATRLTLEAMDHPLPRRMVGLTHQALTNSDGGQRNRFHLLRFSKVAHRFSGRHLESLVQGRLVRADADTPPVGSTTDGGVGHEDEDGEWQRPLYMPYTQHFGYLPDGQVLGYGEAADASASNSESTSDNLAGLVSYLELECLSSVSAGIKEVLPEMLRDLPLIRGLAHDTALSKHTIPSTARRIHLRDLGTTGYISNDDPIPSHPHLEVEHGRTMSTIVLLSGPTAVLRFPQHHVDVVLEPGDAVVAPLGDQIHHLLKPETMSERVHETQSKERVFLVLYTRRDLEDQVRAMSASNIVFAPRLTRRAKRKMMRLVSARGRGRGLPRDQRIDG